MKIQLIDVDSIIPNLALMRISTYHKIKGDSVFLKRYAGERIPVGPLLPDPDITYISKVFQFSIMPIYPTPKELLFVGGVGINDCVKLPSVIDGLKPDYDLYPSTYSMGRTTIGCFRHCYFCRVPTHEGTLRIWEHPKHFHDNRFNTIQLLDNNWLKIKDWFLETSQWIIDNKLKLIENGVDVRLFDNDIITQLTKLKYLRGLKIAFDSMDYQDSIINGITALQAHGFDTRNNLICYCYLHDNSIKAFENLIERIEILRSMRTSPFVMFNCENTPNQRTQAIKRYGNKHQFFWKMTFQEYCQKAYAKPIDIYA